MSLFEVDMDSKALIFLIVLTTTLLLSGIIATQGLENAVAQAQEDEVEGRVDILVYHREDEEYRKEGDEIKRYMSGDYENITFSYRKGDIPEDRQLENISWNFKLLQFDSTEDDDDTFNKINKSLNKGEVDEGLKDAFDQEDIELNQSAELEKEEEGIWVLIDGEEKYQIEKGEKEFEVYREEVLDDKLENIFDLNRTDYEESFNESLNQREIDDKLKEAFEENDFKIVGDKPQLKKEDGVFWIIDENIKKYRIEKTENEFKVYREYLEFKFERAGKHHLTLDLEFENENKTYRDELSIEIEKDERGTFLTAIGAGLAVGIAGMGAGIGVGIAGSAGAGTIAEKPDKFGKCLVYQALPQTQAIYGLLIAVLLLLFTGVIGEGTTVPLTLGVASLGIGLAVGIAGLSAIGQGIASSGSIAAYSEKEELFGKGMVFSVLPETQAIYGLLVGILIMVFTGLLGGNISADLLGDKGLGVAMITIGGGLAVGVAGLSGIGQGIASGAGIGSVAEKEDLFGKGMVFSVLPETQAIYGLLIAILLMVFSGLLGGGAIDAMAGYSGFGLGLIGIGAGLAVGVAGLSGIGQGIAAASGIGSVAEKEEVFGRAMVFSVLPETQAIYGMLIAILLMIFSGLLGGDGVLIGENTRSIQMFFGLVGVGAGLSVGVAGLSGIGQGIASGSGIATVAEDEQMFGRGMVFSVLPETQAIYGMLIAILLMVFSGMIGGSIPPENDPTLSGIQMGIAAVGAGLAIGIAGVSGVGQGITSGSAIAAVSKREETFGKGMIFSVMSETFAIFGLLIAIFIIVFLGFM